MQLKSILDICQANETEKFNYTVLKGSTDTEVTGIASDSKKSNRRWHICMYCRCGKRWT